MIGNYFKLALRVLGRNKFFTAISLFGISFTIAILMLIVSVLETEVGKTPPLTEKDKMVVVPNLGLRRQFYDTIFVYDTTHIQGNLVIDTTYTLDEAGSNNSNNEFAWWFLDEHLSDVPNAKTYTFFNRNNSFNSYINNSKVEMKALYADHRFWEVFDCSFVEGFGFGESSVDQQEQVAVITTYLADQYFGRTSDVLGEEVKMDGKTYKVMGLIEPPGVTILSLDIIIPHTLLVDNNRGGDRGFGGFMAAYLGETVADTKLIKEDIKFIESRLEVPAAAAADYDIITTEAMTFHEAYSSLLLDLDDPELSLRIMRWVIFTLLGLFILLPALNLINLNISRIMERSAEIGVRKAFGASKTNILSQFLIENIIQTFLGGVIGFVLAMLFIYLINDSRIMGDVILKINMRFFIYSIIICFAFGLASGILPAYKMSKLHVASALKQNKL